MIVSKIKRKESKVAKFFRKLIKKLTVPQLIREYNKKKKEAEVLLKDADSFLDLLEVTAADKSIDLDDVDAIAPPPEKDMGGFTDVAPTIGQQQRGVGVSPNAIVHLDNFEAPNRKTLAKNVSILARMEDNLDAIWALKSELVMRNSEVGKNMLKSMTEFYKTVNAKANEVSKLLTDLSEKHEPKIMRDIREAAYNFILNKMLPKGSYGGIENDLYVSAHDAIVDRGGPKEADIQFTSYIYLHKLDKDLYLDGDMTIIITGVVFRNPRRKRYSMEVYVTALDSVDIREMTPGRFDIGERMNGNSPDAIIKSVKNEIDNLISMHRINPELAAMKLGRQATTQALRESAIMSDPAVSDVAVDKNKIWIFLEEGTTDKQAMNAYYRILPILNKRPGIAHRNQRKLVKGFHPTITEVHGQKALVIIKVRQLQGRD